MSKRQAPNIPASLLHAQRRFEQWRKRHRPRARLPEELWSLAVELARVHGVSQTARTLRLAYYSLKKKFVTAPDPGLDHKKAAPDFIELLPTEMGPPRPECTIELEDGSGSKMRIHLKGSELPDLASITRVFRRDEA